MGTQITRRAFLKALTALGGLTLISGGCTRRCVMEDLEIVPRADWDAAPPNLTTSDEGAYDPQTNPAGWYVYDAPLTEALHTLVVHHSARDVNDGAHEIQRLHMELNGFADIGYHFVIDAEGIIYEGRPITARGAHTGGRNTGTIGVVLLGNFEELEPTPAQLESLEELGRCLRDTYVLTHLAGHRDFQPGVTVCPGKNLAAYLPQLAEDLSLTFGTGGYVGTPEPK
jgi:hypothetical protein